MESVPVFEKWTRIRSAIVSPEALDVWNQTYEVGDEWVLVHRDLAEYEVQGYAASTRLMLMLREIRERGAGIPGSEGDVGENGQGDDEAEGLRTDDEIKVPKARPQSDPLQRLISRLQHRKALSEQHAAFTSSYPMLVKMLDDVDTNWRTQWDKDPEWLSNPNRQFIYPEDTLDYIHWKVTKASNQSYHKPLPTEPKATAPLNQSFHTPLHRQPSLRQNDRESVGGILRASAVSIASVASSNWPDRASRSRLSFQGSRWDQSLDATTVGGFSALTLNRDGQPKVYNRFLSSLSLPLEQHLQEEEGEVDADVVLKQFRKTKVGRSQIPEGMLKALNERNEPTK